MTLDEINAYVADRIDESHKAQAKVALGTLLWLAHAAREEFPTATGIRIGASDQGDWMDFEALVDADGGDLTEDVLGWDDEARCWNFDDNNRSTWEEYCTETERSRRHNPQYVIDIDTVLKGVKLT